jgi:hypothetical protein
MVRMCRCVPAGFAGRLTFKFASLSEPADGSKRAMLTYQTIYRYYSQSFEDHFYTRFNGTYPTYVSEGISWFAYP